IGIAIEFHETAEREPADLPLGAMAVMPAHDAAAETDGEGFDAYAAGARHEEMPEFVKEHHDGDQEEEGGNGVERPTHEELQRVVHPRPCSLPFETRDVISSPPAGRRRRRAGGRGGRRRVPLPACRRARWPRAIRRA